MSLSYLFDGIDMTKCFKFLIVWFLLALAINGFGQEIYKEMKDSELKPSTVVPLDTSIVVLVVKSVIKNLEFETNHGKIISWMEAEGEWRLRLEPGTHLVTFSASGFQSLTVRIYIPSMERSREIEIRPVTLEPQRKSSKKWLWIGLGTAAAVVGGYYGINALIEMDSNIPLPQNAKLPNPSGVPTGN